MSDLRRVLTEHGPAMQTELARLNAHLTRLAEACDGALTAAARLASGWRPMATAAGNRDDNDSE